MLQLPAVQGRCGGRSLLGFLGYINDVKQDIAGYLPEECQNMADYMEDIEDREFNDYLYGDYDLEYIEAME